MVKECLRRAFLDNFAVIKEDYAVADSLRKFHFVGDNQHSAALTGKLKHCVKHLAHHFGIKRGGNLVKEHHLRVHTQRPDNCNTLFLSA